MDIPASITEQLPVVVVFVLFTMFLIGLGLKAEAKGRGEYLSEQKAARDTYTASQSEARSEYLNAIRKEHDEHIVSVREMTAEVRGLSEGVRQLAARRK